MYRKNSRAIPTIDDDIKELPSISVGKICLYNCLDLKEELLDLIVNSASVDWAWLTLAILYYSKFESQLFFSMLFAMSRPIGRLFRSIIRKCLRSCKDPRAQSFPTTDSNSRILIEAATPRTSVKEFVQDTCGQKGILNWQIAYDFSCYLTKANGRPLTQQPSFYTRLALCTVFTPIINLCFEGMLSLGQFMEDLSANIDREQSYSFLKECCHTACQKFPILIPQVLESTITAAIAAAWWMVFYEKNAPGSKYIQDYRIGQAVYQGFFNGLVTLATTVLARFVARSTATSIGKENCECKEDRRVHTSLCPRYRVRFFSFPQIESASAVTTEETALLAVNRVE